MRRILCIAMAALLAAASVLAGEKPPQKALDLVHGELLVIASDPVLVAAVQAENAKNKTLAQIKDLDQLWVHTPGLADYMRAMMESEAGKRLRHYRALYPFISELFLTDRLGANVAMSDKTSDYWQGDEAKFTECARDGGRIYVSDAAYDRSTQAYLMQAALPVKDAGGFIGALIIGIDVDMLR